MPRAVSMFDTEAGLDESPMLGDSGSQRRLRAEEAVPSTATQRLNKALLASTVFLAVVASACLVGLAGRGSRREHFAPQDVQRAFGVDSPVPGSSLFQGNQASSAAGPVPLTSDGADELMQSTEVPTAAIPLTDSSAAAAQEEAPAAGSTDFSDQPMQAPLTDEAVPAPQDAGSPSGEEFPQLPVDQGDATVWTADTSQATTASPTAAADDGSQGWAAAAQDAAVQSDAMPDASQTDAAVPTDTAVPTDQAQDADVTSGSSDALAGSSEDDLAATPPAEASQPLDAQPIEDAMKDGSADSITNGQDTVGQPSEDAMKDGSVDSITNGQDTVGQPSEALAPAHAISGPAGAQDQLATPNVEGALVTTTPLPECGLIEDEINYPGNDVAQIKNVSSPEECCARCAGHPMCSAWTWGKKRDVPFSDVCFLKGAHPRMWLTKLRDADFVSGKPQGKRTLPSQWPTAGKSLYCFSLMLPRSYEQQLLQLQFMKSASIFVCDEYGIYSNESIEVMPGLSTSVVHSSLKCSVGGEFKTALNTNIFMEVWKKVVSDGRFMFHDWTVKVDPDCVFFPNRLQHILESHSEDNSGTYLNNCWRGLHGPIEVFSKNAVQAWGAFSDLCVQYFNKLCSGPCLWGEDMFIDQCLQKVLKVRRDDEFMLLLEDHCDPIPDWRDCNNQSVAAFHPFKTIDGYWLCVNNAKKR